VPFGQLTNSASLRLRVGVTNLPYWLKSETDGEVTFICTRRTPRGGWRQRAVKEKPRNLRDPRPTIVLSERESDGLIVARKGLTILERRGLTVSVQRSKRHAAAWLRNPEALLVPPSDWCILFGSLSWSVTYNASRVFGVTSRAK